MRLIIKTYLWLFLCCMPLIALAQPSAVKKAADAVFTLTTFKADGSILATSNGVFIDKSGVGVSAWKPFVGASQAVIINNKGERYDVSALLGANEIYDIAQFTISQPTPAMPLATEVMPQSKVWIVPTAQSSSPIETHVRSVEKFMLRYNYSLLDYQLDEQRNGAAVVNDKGQLVGILSSTTQVQSATDAAFTKEFKLTGLSQNDAVLTQSNLRIALPSEPTEAFAALLLANAKPEKYYEETIREYIDRFPQEIDGYHAQALLDLQRGNLPATDKTLQYMLKQVKAKDKAHYYYALIMYEALFSFATSEKAKQFGWTLDKAVEELKRAQSLKKDLTYDHLMAKFNYSMGKYEEAYREFEALTKSELNNAELYLEMAQCVQELKGDDNKALELINKAIAQCDTSQIHTAAPYFYARAQQYDKMGEYRKSMFDYKMYEYIYQGDLGAEFYYNKFKVETKGKLWQQALQDILMATRLAPKELLYYIEAANLLLKVNELSSAIQVAQ